MLDSLDEVDQLADRIAKVKTNGHLPAQRGKVSDFVASLKVGQQRALRALALHGGEVLDSELCAAVGVTDNLSLAGRILSPIARLAKSAGIQSAIIKKMPSINAKTKERTLYYVIPPDVIDEVKKGLGM